MKNFRSPVGRMFYAVNFSYGFNNDNNNLLFGFIKYAIIIRHDALNPLENTAVCCSDEILIMYSTKVLWWALTFRASFNFQ